MENISSPLYIIHHINYNDMLIWYIFLVLLQGRQKTAAVLVQSYKTFFTLPGAAQILPQGETTGSDIGTQWPNSSCPNLQA